MQDYGMPTVINTFEYVKSIHESSVLKVNTKSIKKVK